MRTLAYVGIDVDDKAFHVGVVDQDGNEISQFACKPSVANLLKKLEQKVSDCKIICGYEASYIGYTLQRQLASKGLECKVIVPTSIPRSPNERVKNDRVDALKLAKLLSKNSLDFVRVPTTKQESERALLRSREFTVSQSSSLKRHILSLCREMGLDYMAETGAKKHWTRQHRDWLDKKLTHLDTEYKHFAFVLRTQISNLENLNRALDEMDAEIERLSEAAEYKDGVTALLCLKGVQIQTAMLILTEVFDINRFKHPKQFMAFMGFDVREYSSGGKQKQFGISKMGNKRLRKALVESCQKFATSSTPSKRLKARRKGAKDHSIKIADRAQERLYKKGHRLLMAGKPRNVVKVAAARELAGFIWETLKAA